MGSSDFEKFFALLWYCHLLVPWIYCWLERSNCWLERIKRAHLDLYNFNCFTKFEFFRALIVIMCLAKFFAFDAFLGIFCWKGLEGHLNCFFFSFLFFSIWISSVICISKYLWFTLWRWLIQFSLTFGSNKHSSDSIAVYY